MSETATAIQPEETAEENVEIVEDPFELSNPHLNTLQNLLFEYLDFDKAEINAIITDNCEEFHQQLKDPMTKVLIIAQIKCWTLRYVDPKTVLEEENKSNEVKVGEKIEGENGDEDDEGLEISEAMLAKAAAMARRKQQRKSVAKPGVLDDQNISKKTKGQSPKKVRAIEAEPSKKRGRRSKSKGRKTGGKSELHQQMQEYQEESDPAALGMVLYPKPHDKIVISWNQLQQTTDTIQKILCLIRNCNSVEDTEEKNLLDSFDLGCFDNPTVVLRVLDCLNEVDSFEDTTETDMLIFLFRNLLKKDGHDRIVDKTVAQMLEITQAYTANFKVTESVEGKLKTGLQDLRIFEKSSLSSALSRWNEVAEKALNEFKTPAAKSIESYLSHWSTVISTVKCLQFELDQFGIDTILSYFEGENLVCQRILATWNQLRSVFEEAAEAVFGFLSLDSEIRCLKSQRIYNLLPILKSMLIKMKLLPLTAPSFNTDRKQQIIRSILDAILWNLRKLLVSHFSDFNLVRQYEIVSQSRDVLAEFRLLISETQQDAEVHFQRLSTWNFDIKSIFVDSDYACIVCQELCEVLKNLIFLQRFCSVPEFRDFADNSTLRSIQATLENGAQKLLAIKFDLLHSSNQPSWVRHIDSIKTELKISQELAIKFLNCHLVDVSADKYPENVYKLITQSNIGNTPAAVWTFFQQAKAVEAIETKITQLGSVWKLVNSTSLNDMDMIRSRILRLGDIQETLTHCHVTENLTALCMEVRHKLSNFEKKAVDQFINNSCKILAEFNNSSPVINSTVNINGVELELFAPRSTVSIENLLVKIHQFNCAYYGFKTSNTRSNLQSLVQVTNKVVRFCKKASKNRHLICATLNKLNINQLMMISEVVAKCQSSILQQYHSSNKITNSSLLEERTMILTNQADFLLEIHHSISKEIDENLAANVFSIVCGPELTFEDLLVSLNDQINHFMSRFVNCYSRSIPQIFDKIPANSDLAASLHSLEAYKQHLDSLMIEQLSKSIISTMNNFISHLKSDKSRVLLSIEITSEMADILQEPFELLIALMDTTISRLQAIKPWAEVKNSTKAKLGIGDILLSHPTMLKGIETYKRFVAEHLLKLRTKCRVTLDRMIQIETDIAKLTNELNCADKKDTEKQPILYEHLAMDYRLVRCVQSEIKDIQIGEVSEGIFHANFNKKLESLNEKLSPIVAILKDSLKEQIQNLQTKIAESTEGQETPKTSFELLHLRHIESVLVGLYH